MPSHSGADKQCKDDVKLTYHDKIPRQQLLMFADKSKKNKCSSILEDEGQSFADILSRYDKKVLDLQYLMSWPVTTRPWSICKQDEKS